MNVPLSPNGQGSSTRPYLIRALHDWCIDNGFTPYLAVYVDESVRVPMEYVKNREIVLNVSFDATSGLTLGNEVIEFKARFGGVAREILVPVDHVVAIYARENGQGMAFPVPLPTTVDGPGPGAVPGTAVSGALSTPVAAPRVGSASVQALPAGPKLHRADEEGAAGKSPRPPKPPKPPGGGRPTLKRVK